MTAENDEAVEEKPAEVKPAEDEASTEVSEDNLGEVKTEEAPAEEDSEEQGQGYIAPKEDLSFPLKNDFVIILSDISLLVSKGSTKDDFIGYLEFHIDNLKNGKASTSDLQGDLEILQEYIDYVENME